MQRQHRLGPDRQFRYVYRRGQRVSGKEMTLVYVKARGKRVGFSVSKKVGGAVVRNRQKRLLREIFRTRMSALPEGLYVVVARPGLPAYSLGELAAQVDGLLRRLQNAGAPGRKPGGNRAAGQPATAGSTGVSQQAPPASADFRKNQPSRPAMPAKGGNAT